MDNQLPEESLSSEAIIYQITASLNSPLEENDPCFAACSNGLLRSMNGGRTWEDAFGSLSLESPLATTAIALSPDFQKDQNLIVGVAGGLLKSMDRGRSWLGTEFPTPPPTITSLAISPNFAEDGVVLAGTMEDGVLRSANQGDRWAAWNFGLLDLSVMCLAISPDFARDEILFAGTESGLFHSTNGGRAWREVNLPIGYEPVISLAISPNFAKDKVLFAGTETKGLLLTTDCGETWQVLWENKINQAVNAIVTAPKYPEHPEVLVIHGQDLLLSRDGGNTWSEWRPAAISDKPVSAILAPQGFGLNAPILLGLVGGEILRIVEG